MNPILWKVLLLACANEGTPDEVCYEQTTFIPSPHTHSDLQACLQQLRTTPFMGNADIIWQPDEKPKYVCVRVE